MSRFDEVAEVLFDEDDRKQRIELARTTLIATSAPITASRGEAAKPDRSILRGIALAKRIAMATIILEHRFENGTFDLMPMNGQSHPWAHAEVVLALELATHPDPARVFRRISTDTRRLRRGDLFVALERWLPLLETSFARRA